MTFSPDGKWFWNGNEWIPAPPNDESVDDNSTNTHKSNTTSYVSPTNNNLSNNQIQGVSYSKYYLYYFFIVSAWTQIYATLGKVRTEVDFLFKLVILFSALFHFFVAGWMKKSLAFTDQEVPVSKQVIAGLIAVIGLLYGLVVGSLIRYFSH